MEDSWIVVDDDGFSSDQSCPDSDQIDSETEAELYSKIHYEENLPGVNCVDSECVKPQPSDLLVCPLNQVENFFGLSVDSNHLETAEKNSDVSETVIKSDHNSSLSRKRKSTSVERSPSIILCQSDSDDSSKLKYTTKSKKAKVSDSAGENYTVIIDSSDSFDSNKEDNFIWKENTTKNKAKQSSSQAKSISEKNCLVRLDSVGENNTVVVDSSDSDKRDNFIWKKLDSQEENVYSSDSDNEDNFIWKKLDSQEENDLQTNLSDNSKTIFLNSSDSELESENVSSPYLNRNSILRNLSMPNIKVGENSEDQWFINEEDLYRRKRYGTPRRYHDKEMICSNCSKKGHSFRACPAPRDIKCYVCGGRHTGNRCYNRICSNCYTYGHDWRTCNRSVNNSCCALCSMRGHIAENCPDLWRRYHLTTEPTNDLKRSKRVNQVQDIDMYCWNCGQIGHFGGVCTYGSRSNKCTSTWPCVISYNNPRKLLSRRLFINFGIQKEKVKKIKKQKQNRICNPSESTSYHNENRLEKSQKNGMVSNSQKLEAIRSARKEKKLAKKSKIDRFQNLARQKDFPRTKPFRGLKSNEPVPISNEPMPEFVNKILVMKEKRRQRNKRRQQRRKYAKLQKNRENFISQT